MNAKQFERNRPYVSLGCLSLLLITLLSVNAVAQQDFDFPIPGEKDRFVYANDEGTPTGLLCRYSDHWQSFAFRELRKGFDGYTYVGPMLTDSNGVVFLDGPSFRDLVFCPLRRPATAVVRFDGMEWTWHAFDTTVFGRSISAITYRSGFGLAQRVRTVGEYYGLLYDRDKGEVLRLNSAVIGGIPYNRETVARAYVSICGDRMMQYRVQYSGGSYSYRSYYHSGDRIENGIRYAVHPLFRSPLTQQPFPYGIHVTAGPGGVSIIGGGVIIPATVSIGDLIAYDYFITDTASMQFGGGLKRVLTAGTLSGYAYGVYAQVSIVENVGVLRSFGGNMEYSWNDALVYYTGCGESWGTPVSVPGEKPTLTHISLSVSPSPSSAEHGHATVRISSPASGEAALHVTDVLGKRVHEERFRIDEGSNPVYLGIGGYTSGMYIVSVTMAGERAWTKLLVR
ncbi:MAG: T9SS type A sorting domain-containing protein [Bacteroidia bacterium]|nr:T9SS type A sorting domain-containing protein [Bacteroidia bacterium]